MSPTELDAGDWMLLGQPLLADFNRNGRARKILQEMKFLGAIIIETIERSENPSKLFS